MRHLRRGFLLLGALALGAGVAAGDPVSREAPDAFTKYLSEHLTPAKKALAIDHPFKETTASGTIVLREQLHRIEPEGRRTWVRHEILQPKNEAGVRQISTIRLPFRKSEQKAHLILARSTQPDGVVMPVQNDAAFVQVPQYEAEYSIYSDLAEVVIVFPNVKPGTLVEYVAAFEERAFRIPGEFTLCSAYQSYWPRVTSRTWLELPDSMAKRLKVTPVGAGLPKASASKHEGFTQFVWEQSTRPEFTYEPDHAPLQQVGPCIWLSTLPDWDAFATWFSALLRGRNELGDDLRKQVDTWTAGVKDRDKLIELLLRKVADDVRYVALAFGQGAFQPHDCNEVWQNQYGDCKDKANLLQAMLKHKGIQSFIALVNTDHAGLLIKESPDYRHFSHAILAVPGRDGYRFCDPTIPYLAAGRLGPGSSGREILVIKPEGCEFVRTPDRDLGTLRYAMDLKVTRSGELSGWLTITAAGYYSASFRDYFRSLDRDGAIRRMRRYAQGFFPAAKLIDVSRPKEQGSADDPYEVKGYFLVPPGQGSDQRTHYLRFPSAFILPNLENIRARATPYMQHKRELAFTIRYQMPKGWGPRALPSPFAVMTFPAEFTASWETQNAACIASLRARYKHSNIPRDKYVLLHNAVSSLKAWLGKPLEVGPRNGVEIVPSSPAADLEDFHMMLSGEGQLALVEEKYPDDGDPRPRKEALKKVIQWFPDDKTAVFEARTHLIDMEEDLKKKIDDFRKLLADYRPSDVGIHPFAWAEYLLATELGEAGETEASVKTLLRLGRNRNLSSFRRGWSLFSAAETVREKSGKEAIAVLREAIQLDSPALVSQVGLLAELLAEERDPDAVAELVRTICKRFPDRAQEVGSALIERVRGALSPDSKIGPDVLLAPLEKVLNETEKLSRLLPELGKLKEERKGQQAHLEVQEAIRKFAAASPPGWYQKDSAPKNLKSREEYQEELARLEEEGDVSAILNLILPYLLRFEPDPTDFGKWLWGLTWRLVDYHTEDEHTERFIQLCEMLPESSKHHWEGLFTRARWYTRRGKMKEAVQVYSQFLEEGANLVYKVSACKYTGRIYEEWGKHDQALQLYREAERLTEENWYAYDAMLRAAFIHLERNNRGEALRLLKALGQLSDDTVETLDSPAQIRELGGLGSRPEAANAYWKAQEKWWPKWKALEAKLGLRPAKGGIVVPEIPGMMQYYDAAEEECSQGLANAFFERMRQVAHATRWQPSAAKVLSWMLWDLRAVRPLQTDECMRFGLALNRSFVGPDAESEKYREFQLAWFYRGVQETEECLKAAKSYLDTYPIEADDDCRVACLYGEAAAELGRGVEDALVRVEKALQASGGLGCRPYVVSTLATLYQRLDRVADARELLKREIQNPVVAADEDALRRLKSHYHRLGAGKGEKTPFARSVRKWLHSFQPAWLDFTRPESVNDLSMEEMERILEGRNGAFNVQERIKAGLLAAQDSRRFFRGRSNGLAWAAWLLAWKSFYKDERRALIESIVHNESLTLRERQTYLYRLAVWEAPSGEVDHVERYQKLGLYEGMTGHFKKSIRNFLEYRKVCDDVSELEAHLLVIAPKKPESNEMVVVSIGIDVLIRHGALAAARRVYDALAKAEWQATAWEGKAQRQFWLLRKLEKAEGLADAHGKMREQLLQACSTTKDTDLWKKLHRKDDLPFLDRETAFRVRLARIRHRDVELCDPGVWTAVLHYLTHEGENRELAKKLFQTAIQDVRSDDVRAHFIGHHGDAYDIDDPRDRKELFAATEPYRDKNHYPYSFEAIVLTETKASLRTGGPLRPRDALKHLETNDARDAARLAELGLAVRDRDAASAAEVLDEISYHDLTSTGNIPLVLPALELCKRKEQAEVVRGLAKWELPKYIVGSWHTFDDFDLVFDLVEALGGEPEYPPEWVAYCTNHVKDEMVRGEMLVRHAQLTENWRDLLRHTEAFLQRYPREYDYYWQKGLALHRLGRGEEAAKALRLFCKYCQDSFYYRLALQILETPKE